MPMPPNAGVETSAACRRPDRTFEARVGTLGPSTGSNKVTSRRDNPMGTANKNYDALHTQNDPRWSAVVDRVASFDGKFVYAVRSTGVYCRPSCPSRQGGPPDVILFSS